MVKTYDIAIIGAGAAGLTCAFTAAGFSKKVVLIDKNLPGGECTWSGCIPSKTLINIAEKVHLAKKYAPDLKVDSAEILSDIQQSIQRAYAAETPEVLQEAGIDYINGYATFVAPHIVAVNGERIEAKKFILSTGSSPMVPSIDGLDTVPYLTNETIFTLKSFPETMTILGGGAIGVEMSQALNRIGVKVTLIEKSESILSNEEEEFALMMQQRLIDEGVIIHTSSDAVKAQQKDGQIELTIEQGSETMTVSGAELLVALGRKANVEGYGLEKAGVEYDKKHIKVDEHMETTAKGIYAVGDVVGPYQLSHMANAQGITAAQNAILPINKRMDYEHVTWCTYTDPELGRSGLSEEEARKQYGDSIRIYELDYSELDRAKTTADPFGKAKIILDKKGFILGATVLGERAGEIISQIQTIKTLKINLGKLSGVIHPYPTYSELLVKIGKKVYVDNLLNLPVAKAYTKVKELEADDLKGGAVGVTAVLGTIAASMAIKNNRKPRGLGVHNGRLKEMPFTPNAVSSQTAKNSARVQPLPYDGSKDEAKKNLLGMLKGYEGVEIVEIDTDYIYAVWTSSTMKFHDDIEFYFNDRTKQIDFRSASRVGYSDAGVNRKRYNEMRKRYLSISAHSKNTFMK